MIAAALLCFRAKSSDADIQAITALVSQDLYTTDQQTVERMGLGKYGGALFNQGTRGRAFTGMLGDKGNQETRKFLAERFASLGLHSAIQGRFRNVVAEQTGASTPENIVILCAHYDTRKSNTPGGDGDASGVAGVTEAARCLSQYKFDNTIRFIVFNAEQKNLDGSYDYANMILGAGKEKLVGAVDLDQILHPYHDKNPALAQEAVVGIGTRSADALAWASAFTAAAQQFVPALALDASGPVTDFSSDHYAFVQNGFNTALRISENSSKDIANASLNTAGDASDGVAGVHYNYAFAANVVRAATAFVAQQAGYEGAADSSATDFPDSDGDGYSDEIEVALNSDPALAVSTPMNLPAATQNGYIETVALVIELDFALDSADGLTLTGYAQIPDGYSPAGGTAIVDVGGVVKAFPLKAGGSGKKGLNSFTLKIKKTKGIVLAQLAQFSCTFSAGNYKRQFAKFGMLNGNYSLKPVTIPVTVILDNQVRTTMRILTYNCNKDAVGGAK